MSYVYKYIYTYIYIFIYIYIYICLQVRWGAKLGKGREMIVKIGFGCTGVGVGPETVPIFGPERPRGAARDPKGEF